MEGKRHRSIPRVNQDFTNSVITLARHSNHFCKMAPSLSRSFYWALGCSGWAPGKTQPSTGYAPYSVLMDDVLVRFLTFHIKDIKQQPKRSWQQKAVSFSTRYLLVEGPKKIWFAMELAPSDLP